MLPYWLLLALPAVASYYARPLHYTFKGERGLFLLTIAIVAVMIGLRYRVGGDWGSYLGHLTSAAYLRFEEIPEAGDPGYVLLNWLAARLGGDVRLVNLVCGAAFAFGLYRFTRTQPSPWLATAVAIPYLVVVVAMGYSRQGVAIGLAMAGLADLVRFRSVTKFVLWVLAAATFHKSAVLLVPIAALTAQRGRVWAAFWVLAGTAAGYFVLLEKSVDSLVRGYIEAEYESDGAAIRIAMNAAPAVVFLAFRRRFPIHRNEERLWLIISILALAFVPALFVLPSTAVDRLGLYLIPLQMVVLSRVPLAFARTVRGLRFLTLVVLLYAAAILFIWLNYAGHADAWLPYQLYLI